MADGRLWGPVWSQWGPWAQSEQPSHPEWGMPFKSFSIWNDRKKQGNSTPSGLHYFLAQQFRFILVVCINSKVYIWTNMKITVLKEFTACQNNKFLMKECYNLYIFDRKKNVSGDTKEEEISLVSSLRYQFKKKSTSWYKKSSCFFYKVFKEWQIETTYTYSIIILLNNNLVIHFNTIFTRSA